jgi:hypothetical protein
MADTRLLVPVVLAAVGVGCSSNPLDGTWTTANTVLTVTLTETIEVNGDGTLTVSDTASSASCSGSWTTTGYAWAATASSITFSGTPTCTGSITCGPLSLSCAGNQGLTAGSCTYALSNANDTLALTACSGTSDLTLTRAD